MEITLTPEIEEGLVQQARQLGISPQELALESLRRQFATAPQTEASGEVGQTLADFLGDTIGALDSGEFIPGGARMSESADDVSE